MKYLRLCLQIVLPVVVLLLGVMLTKSIASRKNEPIVAPPAVRGPLVRIQTATATDLRIDVPTQGTVEPFRVVELSPQVAGRVVATSPNLRPGGFFAEDEVLVEIDAADFELAIVQQDAAVARAELRLQQERAEAEASLRAWRQLEGDRPPDPLGARAPQIVDAEKSLAAARAMASKSQLDLQRTKVRAPFAGCVRQAAVEVGQTVQIGQRLATVFDRAVLEVRLPIPVADAAFLDLPMQAPVDGTAGPAPAVQIEAEFAGQHLTWTGTIVRTEGEIDRRTRQMTLVARLEPAARPAGQDPKPPLLVGMFVQALVRGRTCKGVVAVSRAAVHEGTHVWIVDAEQRLRRRDVQILRAEADRIVLRSGLAAGEQVCITNLETPTEGMPVRIVDGAATTVPGADRAK